MNQAFQVKEPAFRFGATGSWIASGIYRRELPTTIPWRKRG